MIELKIADTEEEYHQIHQLNYATFVEEIPQHTPNAQQKLVDKFHLANHYLIAKENTMVVGMLAYNSERPFSIDQKIQSIEQYLPEFKKPIEIRLLSIAKHKRSSTLFYALIKKLVVLLHRDDFDIALISGTTRQLKLYHKIGFVDFGTLVGKDEALYQPMYLTKNTIQPDYINQWLNESTSPQDL